MLSVPRACGCDGGGSDIEPVIETAMARNCSLLTGTLTARTGPAPRRESERALPFAGKSSGSQTLACSNEQLNAINT